MSRFFCINTEADSSFDFKTQLERKREQNRFVSLHNKSIIT